MPITVDMSDVEDFGALDPGEYEVVVTDVEERQGQKAPYLSWEMTIVEGQYEDRKVWNNTSLSPQSMPFLKQFLTAAGLDPDDMQGQFEFDPADFIGARLRIQTGVQEYEGQERTRVTKVMRSSDTKPRSL